MRSFENRPEHDRMGFGNSKDSESIAGRIDFAEATELDFAALPHNS